MAANLAPRKLGRGELYARVLAVLSTTKAISTREVAAAVPTTIANAGVALHRCAEHGLAKRATRERGKGRQMRWKATGKTYTPRPNGAPPQPDRPKSRHRPKAQQPSVRTPAQVAMRERIHVQTTQAPPKAIAAQTVDEYLARGGRIDVLPPTRYVPSPVRPCGWKS